jgi:hypothetical protein
MSCGCTTYQCINISLQACAETVTLPSIVADETGIWTMVLEFNGVDYRATVNVGNNVAVTIPNRFNEDYTHTLKFYRADGTLVYDTCYTIKTTPFKLVTWDQPPVDVPAAIYAYWVVKDANTPPTENELLAGTAVAITHNQNTISYDLTGVVGDKWIFLAEPSAETPKMRKYTSVTDDEALGSDGQFNTRQVVGSMAYYPSNFPTSNPQYPIQLRVS